MKVYLPDDNTQMLARALNLALQQLGLEENFGGFSWQGEILPSSEVSIVNKLDRIPSGYLVTSLSGSATLLRGTSDWTKTTVSLRNSSASTALQTTVFFLR